MPTDILFPVLFGCGIQTDAVADETTGAAGAEVDGIDTGSNGFPFTILTIEE